MLQSKLGSELVIQAVICIHLSHRNRAVLSDHKNRDDRSTAHSLEYIYKACKYWTSCLEENRWLLLRMHASGKPLVVYVVKQ